MVNDKFGYLFSDEKHSEIETTSLYDNYTRFDKSNKIDDTAIIYPNVVLGKNNVIGAYTVIGSNGEIRGAKDFQGGVIIGDGNIISEHVTIQRPEKKTQTIIGDNNLIMAHSHVGHDVKIGNDCEVCTGTIIGGYAEIKNKVKLKLGVTIRNRIIIGGKAIVGMGSVVIKDVKPKGVHVGNPSRELRSID